MILVQRLRYECNRIRIFIAPSYKRLPYLFRQRTRCITTSLCALAPTALKHSNVECEPPLRDSVQDSLQPKTPNIKPKWSRVFRGPDMKRIVELRQQKKNTQFNNRHFETCYTKSALGPVLFGRISNSYVRPRPALLSPASHTDSKIPNCAKTCKIILCRDTQILFYNVQPGQAPNSIAIFMSHSRQMDVAGESIQKRRSA